MGQEQEAVSTPDNASAGRSQAPAVLRPAREGRNHLARVHTRFMPAEAAALLSTMGYFTEVRRGGKLPLVAARADGFRFLVALDAPAKLARTTRSPGATRCTERSGMWPGGARGFPPPLA